MKLNSLLKSSAIVGGTLFVIALMALGAESLIRYRQAHKYGGIHTVEDMYTTDPALNLRIPRPGLVTGTVRIDSRGFRNDELIYPKPESLIRIAYLGASTTFCAEVSSNEKAWPHLATELLRKHFSNAALDYVNAAVPGYILETSERRLRSQVAQLKPDVIVIYHATNDLSGEMRDIAERQGIYKKGDIEESWLAKRSLLWNLVEKNLRIINSQNQAKAGKTSLAFDPDKIGEGFAKNLASLIRVAKKTAPVVAIPTFSIRIRAEQSSDEKITAAASSLYYMPFMTPDGLIQAFRRYNDIIRRVAAENDVVLVEAAEKIPADGDHFNDTVHFKDAGSAVMANLVGIALTQSSRFQALVDAKSKTQGRRTE